MNLRARLFVERGVTREEMTVTPEDTLRAAGISSKRQARYQRRRSSLASRRGVDRPARRVLEWKAAGI
jgi:hypothetical protein